MGEKLHPSERDKFRRYTGRERETGVRVDEAAFVVGRRGGKDRAASVLATYLAGLCEHPALVKGERGLCLLVAPDQKQSAVTLGYIRAAFAQSPILRQLIVNQTQDALSLSNNIDVTVRASNHRTLRGVTAIAVIASETAFWYDAETGSTNCDEAILTALRPTLLTTNGPLVLISSPYAMRGVLYSLWKQHYGKDDPHILVAQGGTADFNPTINEATLARQRERDPFGAVSEIDGNFRSDVAGFVPREIVEAAIDRGCFERPPVDGVKYFCAVDPSGGVKDSYVMAISHRDKSGAAVIDCIREVRPPFNAEQATAELADTAKRYRVRRIVGERFGGQWPRQAFDRFGLTYQVADLTRSEAYLELLAPLSSKQVRLIDHPRLVNQLASLERRTGRGADVIDHPKGANAHDDCANACALAINLALAEKRRPSLAAAGKFFDLSDNTCWTI